MVPPAQPAEHEHQQYAKNNQQARGQYDLRLPLSGFIKARAMNLWRSMTRKALSVPGQFEKKLPDPSRKTWNGSASCIFLLPTGVGFVEPPAFWAGIRGPRPKLN
jgi:hypothetical protein